MDLRDDITELEHARAEEARLRRALDAALRAAQADDDAAVLQHAWLAARARCMQLAAQEAQRSVEAEPAPAAAASAPAEEGEPAVAVALERVVQAMRALVRQVEQEVAAVSAEERRLARNLGAEQARAASWLERLELAQRAGKPALAAEARERLAAHRALAADLESRLEVARQAVDTLRSRQRDLQLRLERARGRAETVRARLAVHRAALLGSATAALLERLERLQEEVAVLLLSSTT